MARWILLLMPPVVLGCNRPIDDVPGSMLLPEPQSTVQLDRDFQSDPPQVDVLFIIDDGGSMAERQRALGDEADRLLDGYLRRGIDYHVGVISMDLDDLESAGKLRQVDGVSYIDQDTPNAVDVFWRMLELETGGASEPQGRAAAYSMIELNADHPQNAGFYREHASLDLVFVSNRDDQSGDVLIDAAAFHTWLLDKKAAPATVHAHSIVGVPGQPCDAVETPGTAYIAYTDVTGGVLSDRCEPDRSPFFEEIVQRTPGLAIEYFLSRIPVTTPLDLEVEVITSTVDAVPVTLKFTPCLPGEVEQWWSSRVCQVTYRPGRNSVVFLDYLPPPRAEVRMKYDRREGSEIRHWGPL